MADIFSLRLLPINFLTIPSMKKKIYGSTVGNSTKYKSHLESSSFFSAWNLLELMTPRTRAEKIGYCYPGTRLGHQNSWWIDVYSPKYGNFIYNLTGFSNEDAGSKKKWSRFFVGQTSKHKIKSQKNPWANSPPKWIRSKNPIRIPDRSIPCISRMDNDAMPVYA